MDNELKKLCERAQQTANNQNKPMAIFNLNMIGNRLLVIRAADSFKNENRMVAGVFQPQEVKP